MQSLCTVHHVAAASPKEQLSWAHAGEEQWELSHRVWEKCTACIPWPKEMRSKMVATEHETLSGANGLRGLIGQRTDYVRYKKELMPWPIHRLPLCSVKEIT